MWAADREELKRKEKKAAAGAFILFATGIFIMVLWYFMVSTLALQPHSGPEEMEQLNDMFLTLAQVFGLLASLLIALAFVSVIYWAHLRGGRKRKSRTVLIPKWR